MAEVEPAQEWVGLDEQPYPDDRPISRESVQTDTDGLTYDTEDGGFPPSAMATVLSHKSINMRDLDDVPGRRNTHSEEPATKLITRPVTSGSDEIPKFQMSSWNFEPPKLPRKPVNQIHVPKSMHVTQILEFGGEDSRDKSVESAASLEQVRQSAFPAMASSVLAQPAGDQSTTLQKHSKASPQNHSGKRNPKKGPLVKATIHPESVLADADQAVFQEKVDFTQDLANTTYHGRLSGAEPIGYQEHEHEHEHEQLDENDQTLVTYVNDPAASSDLVNGDNLDSSAEASIQDNHSFAVYGNNQAAQYNDNGPRLSLTSTTLTPAPGAHVRKQKHQSKQVPRGSRSFKTTKPQQESSKSRNSTPAQVQTPAVTREPSAEDLLFLVMHRTRLREDAEKQLLAQKEELEVQNSHLQSDLKAHQDRLDQASAREEKLTSDLHGCESQLSDFRSRIDRIKEWAKRTSNEMKDLRFRANEFCKDVDAVKVARNEVAQNIDALQTASTTTREDLVTLRLKFETLRNHVQPLESENRAMRTALDQKEHQIADLGKSNLRLQRFVDDLTAAQSKHNQSLVREQEAVSLHLQRLEDAVKSVETVVRTVKTTRPPGMNECLEILSCLNAKTSIFPENVEQLGELLERLSETITIHAATAAEAAESSRSSAEALRTEIATQIVTVIECVQSKASKDDTVSKLQQANAALDEKSRGKDNQIDEIRRQVTLADTRESNLRASIERIINTLGDAARGKVVTVEHHNSVLATTEGMWSRKWAQVSSQYADERKRAEELTAALEKQEIAYQNVTSQLEVAKVSLEEALENARAADDKFKARQAEFTQSVDTQLAEKDASLRDLQKKLHVADQEQQKAAAKVQALTSDLEEQTRLLGEALRHLQDTSHEFQETKDQMGGTQQELSRLREKAEEVPLLLEQLQTQRTAASELESRLSFFQGVVKENQDLKQNQQNAAKHVQDLESKVHKADKTNSVLGTLNEKVQNMQGQVDALEEALRNARQTAGQVPGLEAEIESRDREIDDIRAKLRDAQKLSEQLPALQAQSKVWEQKSSAFVKDLEAAEKLAFKYQELKSAAKEKDSTISNFKSKVKELDETAQDYALLKEESQTKDYTIAALQRRIHKLGQHSPEIPETNQEQLQMYEEIPNRCFSQDTIISSSPLPDTDTGNLQRRGADRGAQRPAGPRNLTSTAVRATNIKVHNDTQALLNDTPNSAVTEPDFVIPDSQYQLPFGTNITVATVTKQRTERSSSSVNELEDTARLGGNLPKDNKTKADSSLDDDLELEHQQGQSQTHSHPKSSQHSSSSATEQMLLEVVEGAHSAQKEAKHRSGRSHNVWEQTVKPSQDPVMPWNDIANSSMRQPTPRRSGGGNQLLKATPLRERTPSTNNIMPSSPSGFVREKYQPNSAAKRRVENEEDPASTGGSSKRFKRNPGNLKVRVPGQSSRPSAEAQTPQSKSSRINATGMPSASRKGNVIGTNAPAPGKSQRSKPAQKGSKSDRYQTRFSQGTE